MPGCIWRVPQGPDDEQPALFDLRAYEEAVELLADEESRLARVAAGPREDARFHLTYKCDGCLYNALCMREAAEGESLALVPFMTHARSRARWRSTACDSVRELAELKGLPAQGDYTLTASGSWPIPELLAQLER